MKKNFFLQKVDPSSGFVLNELSCGPYFLDDVSAASGISVEEMRTENFLILDSDELFKINKLFGTDFDPGDNDACLFAWSASDGLPYRVHAGREIMLLMSGRKQLATFAGIFPENEAMVEIPDHLIDKLVENGRFVKVEYCELNPVGNNYYRGMRYVLVSPKNESWRINAYILLQKTAGMVGWSEPLTRLQGSLLGYSDQENDEYAECVRNRKFSQDASSAG